MNRFHTMHDFTFKFEKQLSNQHSALSTQLKVTTSYKEKSSGLHCTTGR